MGRHIHIDFETKCELNLREVGLDLYFGHESFRPIWLAYTLGADDEPTEVDLSEDDALPDELLEALTDAEADIWAFNAAFERMVLNRYYKLRIPIHRFRCAMALAYMHAFTGDLEAVGRQIGLDDDHLKDPDGKRLMKIFSMPNKVTKNQPYRWRSKRTDPEDWIKYGHYCGRDVKSERTITNWLLDYPVPDFEWEIYALDQEINDIGIPIDRTFVVNAIRFADKRKKQLTERMQEITDLANPGSVQQLLPWLKARGYPYDDLRKDTVKIALNRHDDPEDKVRLSKSCVKVLKLRQNQARTSVRKYNAILKRLGPDSRIRHILQYGGASRTLRWAGRAMQPQNLPRTPKWMEEVEILERITNFVRDNDYSGFVAAVEEASEGKADPMEALAGLVRSSIRAHEGKKLVVCDLASIESRVIAWLTGCRRLLEVFERDMCAYKDFATELFKIAYEEVTKAQRSDAKPAVLGAGYRLGGGMMREGKKTGLWGYAENMGIELSKDAAHKAVKLFRRAYKEIPQAWYAYEDAILHTVRTGRRTRVGPIRFRKEGQFLTAELPSGRKLWYHKPRIRKEKIRYIDRDGKEATFEKEGVSYMGKQQNGSKWIRIQSHGGKFIENFVQAIARDILCMAMIWMREFGFNLCLHVHDEAVSEHDEDDHRFNHERKRRIMRFAIPWVKGMPLDAAGYSGQLYRKD